MDPPLTLLPVLLYMYWKLLKAVQGITGQQFAAARKRTQHMATASPSHLAACAVVHVLEVEQAVR
jgi:hypothetical protein